MISTIMSSPFIVLTTLACILMFGLGFLPKPSEATRTWSFAFLVAMAGSYAQFGAGILESPVVHALGVGLVLAAGGFLWMGLRQASGRRRSLWPWAGAYLIVAPGALVLTTGSDLFALVFRVDFATSAVFAVLVVIELLRFSSGPREEILPLAIAAALYPFFALFSLIDGVVQAASGSLPADALALVRTVNGIGSSVYIVCALVTLLLIARRSRGPARGIGSAAFRDVATGRLERARRADDTWWSLIDVRLDDPVDMRTALGATLFEQMTERFRRDVLGCLPADADIDEIDDTRIVALLPRSDEAIRGLLITMLHHISEPDPERPVSVRTSASIGWAPISVVGFDLDALGAAAAEVIAHAREKGGDRWERAAAPCAPDERVR